MNDEALAFPRRWNWLFNGFRRYVMRYLRKHFHGVYLAKASAAIPTDTAPLLIVTNHPSWWDPMIGTAISLRFEDRVHYGAIDAKMLKQYPIFSRLGFFGVDVDTYRGAADFLRMGTALLSVPKNIVWVTAQGRFTDVRTRPLGLRYGVGHLAARSPQAIVLPIAIEYAFWNERTPEAFVRIGDPIHVADFPNESGKQWTARIEAALTATLDALNGDAMSRDPERFSSLLVGRAGVGGMYDFFRRVRAFITRQPFQPAHGGDAK